MPLCKNCESQDFLLEDGVYYCSVCQVVSQEAVEEFLDEFQSAQPIAAATLNAKNKSATLLQKCADKGRPWYTIEAFQVILKAQLDALICFGCSNNLYDVIKEIWFKYIHKSGIALIDPSLAAKNNPSLFQTTFRDRYLSGVLGERYLEDAFYPDVNCGYPIKIRLPSFTQSGRNRESSSSSSFNSSDCGTNRFEQSRKKRKFDSGVKKDKPWRSDEEWYSLASDVGSSDWDEGFINPKCVTKKWKNSRQKKWNFKETNNIEDMHLTWLLAILNIGLQWCKESITVGDLLHWIKQGYLPYIDCLKHLLPHMKLTNFDVASIQSRIIPSYQLVVSKTKMLIEFVEIPRTLPDVDIQKLVARYVVQLNLPLTLISFIETFVNVTGFKYKRQRSVNKFVYAPEGAALSLIVVACKLLFGLDDEREWFLEKQVTPCLLHEQCNPFSWKDWSNFHLEKTTKVKENPSNCLESTDVEAINDIHSYMEHWKNVIIEASSTSKERPKEKFRSLRDAAKMKAWPFMKLCDAQGSLNEIERRKLLRQFPYLDRCPENLDMGNRCLNPVFKILEQYDFDFIWYGDTYNRIEKCFRQNFSSGLYNFYYNTWKQGEMNVHLSYDFFLSVASRLSLVDKVVLHSITQQTERLYLKSFLEAKSNQSYSTTCWSQSRRCKNDAAKLSLRRDGTVCSNKRKRQPN